MLTTGWCEYREYRERRRRKSFSLSPFSCFQYAYGLSCVDRDTQYENQLCLPYASQKIIFGFSNNHCEEISTDAIFLPRDTGSAKPMSQSLPHADIACMKNQPLRKADPGSVSAPVRFIFSFPDDKTRMLPAAPFCKPDTHAFHPGAAFPLQQKRKDDADVSIPAIHAAIYPVISE